MTQDNNRELDELHTIMLDMHKKLNKAGVVMFSDAYRGRIDWANVIAEAEAAIQAWNARQIIAELEAAWRRAPKDEDYQPTDPITKYLEIRLAQLKAPPISGSEGEGNNE